ncbi:MAG TPA: DMT family transporter [Stellaceae bacterium]|nr:DMT family transporter [Stellaceae bacterium]
MTRHGFAIGMMVAQAVLFAAETAAVHEIGSRASVMQLALVRGIGGVALAIVIARNSGLPVLRTRQLLLQLARGFVSLAYLWVMMYAFVRMPFADATAISYTQAGYIAIFSILILREPVSHNQWLAGALSMGGAVLIAKPAFAGWEPAYLIAFFGTGLNGLAFVLNRYLQRQDNEATTMFYSNALVILGNAPSLATGPLSFGSLPWLPGVLIFGPLGMAAGIKAVRHASASSLAPYTALRLVIAACGGVIIFRELPDAFSAIGVALILVSCMLTSESVLHGKFFPWRAARTA